MNSTISSIVSEPQGKRKTQRPGSSPQRGGETRAQRGVEIAPSYTACRRHRVHPVLFPPLPYSVARRRPKASVRKGQSRPACPGCCHLLALSSLLCHSFPLPVTCVSRWFIFKPSCLLSGQEDVKGSPPKLFWGICAQTLLMHLQCNPTPEAQGKSQKRGWEDGKSQKSRMSLVGFYIRQGSGTHGLSTIWLPDRASIKTPGNSQSGRGNSIP